MSKEENMEQTQVKQNVEVNLDEIFNGAPGADSITLPEENTPKKPNLFSRPENVDLSFVDEPKEETKEETSSEESSIPESVLYSSFTFFIIMYFPTGFILCLNLLRLNLIH